jgi:hypothetical protein
MQSWQYICILLYFKFEIIYGILYKFSGFGTDEKLVRVVSN